MELAVCQDLDAKTIVIPNNTRMRQKGLTLIELLVTLTIVGVLVSLAVPGFTSFLAKRAIAASLSDLASDFRLARSEALRRGRTVSICRSSNGTSCATSGSWSLGWIVFIDPNPSSPPSVGTGDEVIRVQGAPTGIASILGAAGADPTTGVTFQSTGWARAAGATLVFTPTFSGSSGSTRLFCISNQGRPSVRPEGTTACN